ETDAREAGIYPVVEAEKVTEEDVALEDADTTESTEEVNDVSVETNVEKESE
ncbi:TPA: transcription termination/antitermination protein NusA, partial [Staphylococcus aureus]